MKVITYLLLAMAAFVCLSGCDKNTNTTAADQQEAPTTPEVEPAKYLADTNQVRPSGSDASVSAPSAYDPLDLPAAFW